MPTTNELLQEMAIRHQVNLQRMSAGAVKRLIPILHRADLEIVQELIKRSTTVGGGNWTGRRFQQLLDAVREINRTAYVKMGQQLRKELRDLAKYEATFQVGRMKQAVPIAFDWITPTAPMLNSIVTRNPIQGKLLREWIADLSVAKQKRIRDTLRVGMTLGESNDDIIKRVIGTRSRNFRDGIVEMDRRHAASLVQTATNDIANHARKITYAENEELLGGMQWVATLDARTCEECMALDGKVFEIDGRVPPAHVNCRCTTVPVVKSWRQLGIDLDEAPEGTRASMDGQVPATLSYQQWLKKQSSDVQNEALGPTRGALFRKGRLTVDKFTDRQGNLITLDELRKREELAFERAGL